MTENDFILEQGLNKLFKSYLRSFVTIDAVITAVNDNNTCQVSINPTTDDANGVIYNNVPICVLIGSQASIYPIPVIGSHCLISFRDGSISLPQIVAIDQVDTWKINCATLVEFNGGQNGGMVLVNDLVTKLNNIENLLNDLITKFNSHTHILTLTMGTGTAAPTNNPETGTISPITQATDIESTVITQ